ncbi:MAG: polysaccharide biosynthesis C-terminal domain-containing protein [Flavobacterium sp.]|nr:polysaccharide biosynthesis C-terminal domain-containing protein [Flavobacterium sp.]
MGLYKSLFRQTAIYGFATVLPRMLTFFLTPFYTQILPEAEYGEVSIIFAYMIFFNVVLAYGMETSFFRFYSREENKEVVTETSTVSIFWSALLFLGGALLFRNAVAGFIGIDVQYITFAIWILVLDALVIIPFAKLRVNRKPGHYAVIKTGNVLVNIGLNIFLLVFLPRLASADSTGIFSFFYIENFEIGYIFLSLLVSSFLTFVVLSGNYIRFNWNFDFALWKKMMRYGLPILISGIAFAINEQFDKILLEWLLPADIAKSEVGVYSACYKLGLFMILFRTAYTLGIEPFFFSYSHNKNATQTYATVTKYFIVFGSLIQLAVIVFADLLKVLLLRDPAYWEAMKIVPLIVLANFFLGIYTNLSVWYKLIDKTHIGAYISIMGAVITLALNFILIPHYSYYGSAIATIAAYGSMMLVSWYLGNKHYPIPYEIGKISAYLGLSIVFSIISFYFFRGNYFVGIPLLLSFVAFIYSNERQVIDKILTRKTNT